MKKACDDPRLRLRSPKAAVSHIVCTLVTKENKNHFRSSYKPKSKKNSMSMHPLRRRRLAGYLNLLNMDGDDEKDQDGDDRYVITRFVAILRATSVSDEGEKGRTGDRGKQYLRAMPLSVLTLRST